MGPLRPAKASRNPYCVPDFPRFSRNPGASGKILTTMMIGLAMIESLAIYALVVCLIILFANPYGKLAEELARKAVETVAK